MRKMEGKRGLKKCQKFLEGTPCKTTENALLQSRTLFSSQTLKLEGELIHQLVSSKFEDLEGQRRAIPPFLMNAR